MWKTFASLFIAVAVAMLGIGIISPILPLYVETFSASGLAIGIIMGAFSLSRGLLGPFVGRLSDRIGRKRFLLAGLGIFALVSLCYSLAGNVWQLILVRIIQGAASVMVTPIAQGYVGDITPVGKEGRMMNLFYSSMFIGVGLGPLLGGVLTDIWSYHAAFAGMGILSALSLLLVAMTLPVDHVQVKRTQAKRQRSIIPLRQIAKHDAVKAILTYVATRGFWRQGFNTFYPLFAVNVRLVGLASRLHHVGLFHCRRPVPDSVRIPGRPLAALPADHLGKLCGATATSAHSVRPFLHRSDGRRLLHRHAFRLLARFDPCHTNGAWKIAWYGHSGWIAWFSVCIRADDWTSCLRRRG